MKSCTATYTIREAAARCGYTRPNTFREKFLRTQEERDNLGARYDHKGRLILDRNAVEALASRLDKEREERGNWRLLNLGEWARPRARKQAAVLPRETES